MCMVLAVLAGVDLGRGRGLSDLGRGVILVFTFFFGYFFSRGSVSNVAKYRE
jgi:hypothetical protein